MITIGTPVNIRPKDGRHLRKEDAQILAVDGETVMGSAYWVRLFNMGDIEIVPETLAQSISATVIDPKE